MKTQLAAQEYLREAPKVYKPTVLKFIEFCPEMVSDISRDTWETYREYILKTYNDTTVRDKLTKAKCFLNECVSRGYLRLNTKKLKIPKTLSRRIVAKPEQIAKIESLLNLDDFEDLRDFLMIQCMKMGMRVGEIAALNREDIGGAKQWINERGDVRYYCPIISEKSQQERFIMWSAKTHKVFLKYLGVVVCLNNRPELFISLSGRTRLTTRSIERSFKALCVQAGITEHITPHSVRHMAAHIDNDNGATLKQIQAKLGHTDPRSTLNYLNQNPNEILKSLEKHTPA